MTKEARVACLYRVSTKRQVEGDDIPMQKNACKEFISKIEGWKLVKEYSEKGVSGYHKSAAERDILQQVKSDAEKHHFDVLLVFMFDRLGRREDETPFIVEWFVEQGVQVWSVKEGQQRFENRVDKLLNYIRFWQSGGESEKTSIRVKEKHKQMVEEGLFRGGTPPYGYILVESENRNKKGYKLKKLSIHEKESNVVKTIFNLVTNHGYGGHRVAKYLNQNKIKTKRDNFWTNDTVMSLLKNPIYKGYYVSGKRPSSRGGNKRTPPDSWIYSNEIIPELVIVDEDTWNKAEEIRESRKKGIGKYPKQTKGPLLLVGLAKCGCCGTTMASRYAIKKWTRKKDNEEVQHFQPKYLCQGRSTKVMCTGQRTFSQNKVDPIVLEEVYSYLEHLSEIDLASKISAMQNEVAKNTEKELLSIKGSIRNTTKEIDVLSNEIIKCLTGESNFTSEQLSKIITKKESEIENLRKAEENISRELSIRLREVDSFVELHRMIPNWKDEFEEAPTEVRKMLLAKLIDSVYITNDIIDVRFKFNLFGLK